MDALNARAPERPVVIVLTLETSEFSSRRADRLLSELQAQPRRALRGLARQAGAEDHVVLERRAHAIDSRRARREYQAAENFWAWRAGQSGGRFEQVLADSGVPAAMTAIAEEIPAHYVVVYGQRGDAGTRKISIAVARAGVKVRPRTDLPRGSGRK